MLLNDLGKGLLYVFLDESQDIYRRSANIPITSKPMVLDQNCRNTGADARTFRRNGIPVFIVSAQWLRVPSDTRVNLADDGIPVQSLYDGVRHWKIMLGELAGGQIE